MSEPQEKTGKVSEMVVNSMAPVAIRISNRIHRRVVFVTIGIILVVILGTISVNSGSNRTISYAISMSGVGVGIYWDQACINRTLSLDWELIAPGSNSTMKIYVRNEGDSAVSLWMATSNWMPHVASDYITLVWTYTGRILSAGEVIPMNLILNVDPTVSGITDFSFDVAITAIG